MLVASVGSGLAQDLGLAPAVLGGGSRQAIDVRAAGAAGQPDAGDAGRPALAAGRGTHEAAGPTCASSWRPPPWPMPARSAARTTTATTRSWRWSRRTRCRGAARGGAGAAGLEGALPQHQPHPATRAAVRTKRCTRSSRRLDSGIGRRPRPCCEATRRQDMEGAERTFAALAQGPLDEAYNDLQYLVQDDVNVHRVVLAWRAWACSTSPARSTPTRCSASRCGSACEEEGNDPQVWRRRGLRSLLPKLLDQYGLLEPGPGDEAARRSRIDRLAMTIYGSKREQAAEAVAAALADGWSPEAIGEAISLAANQLVLCDPGRKKEDTPRSPRAASTAPRSASTPPTRPTPGGTSPASANHRNTVASLIVGAYHTAGPVGRAQRRSRIPSPSTSRRSRRSIPKPCSPRRSRPSRATTRPVQRPWSTATARSAARHGRCSTCCSATPSARTGPCTPRSTTAP